MFKIKLLQLIKAGLVSLRNLVLGGNLISTTLLLNPKKMMFYITQNLFWYKTLTDKRGIPQKNVFEILPADNIETIKLANLKNETWFHASSSSASDIISLCLICNIQKPRVIFEIGTLIGYTALHFALNSSDDTKIYTLDLPKKEPVSPALKTTVIDDDFINKASQIATYCFENCGITKKITCLSGDSFTFDFSPFYGKVDIFFIDGSHSYEYVRSDTLNALKCCHAGSIIAWHDFGQMGMSGVTKWLLEFSKKGKNTIYSIPGGSIAFMIVPSP